MQTKSASCRREAMLNAAAAPFACSISGGGGQLLLLLLLACLALGSFICMLSSCTSVSITTHDSAPNSNAASHTPQDDGHQPSHLQLITKKKMMRGPLHPYHSQLGQTAIHTETHEEKEERDEGKHSHLTSATTTSASATTTATSTGALFIIANATNTSTTTTSVTATVETQENEEQDEGKPSYLITTRITSTTTTTSISTTISNALTTTTNTTTTTTSTTTSIAAATSFTTNATTTATLTTLLGNGPIIKHHKVSSPSNWPLQLHHGKLTCPPCLLGRTCCLLLCVDLNTDNLNCGSCGNACAVGSDCELGVCGYAS